MPFRVIPKVIAMVTFVPCLAPLGVWFFLDVFNDDQLPFLTYRLYPRLDWQYFKLMVYRTEMILCLISVSLSLSN